MKRIKGEITVDAPLGVVEAVGRDAKTWPEWNTALKRVVASDDFPQEGSTVEMSYELSGFKLTLPMVATAYAPGDKMELSFETSFVSGKNIWQYGPREDGMTDLACVLEYEIPGGQIGEMIYKGIIERMLADTLADMLENLADVAEQRAAERVAA
ncbi:MAG: SRPBCC family protein [Chloroflexi bacterium]|nr:SRPBCC family protein [Chloroflexota bacterium]